MEGDWQKVQFKLSQAERALEGLSTTKSREDFYDGLAFFLSAARSVVSVLSFQYGLHEFEKGEKVAGTNRHLTLSAAEKEKRQSFDVWLRRSAAPVLTHPLKADRDSDVHREGVSSVKFRLPPGSGLLLEPGGPIGTPLALRGHSWGQGLGLPLEGPRSEDFSFQFDEARCALAVCRDYRALIKDCVEVAKDQV